MKDLIISVAQTLFTKNTNFCLYRFPYEKELKLALDKDFPLENKSSETFWVAPFCTQSSAQEIFLQVLDAAYLTEDFLQACKQIPTQSPFPNHALPKEISKDAYFEKINGFLRDIRSKELDKVILSRVIIQDKPAGFEPLTCLKRLIDSYPNTFVYFLFHREAGLWMGASAELLLQKKGAQVAIMSLAGTQSRNSKGEYFWRPKELEEHQMVAKHIEDTFLKHHYSLQSKNGPLTIESGQVAHLKTNYIFEEHESLPMRDLLNELHPTPAIGGLPARKGLSYILEHEGYDRKYYCGFLGETNFNTSASLYINLRCMQINQEQIAAYVGGGITAASDPQEEWEETILKSKTILDKINA